MAMVQCEATGCEADSTLRSKWCAPCARKWDLINRARTTKARRDRAKQKRAKEVAEAAGEGGDAKRHRAEATLKATRLQLTQVQEQLQDAKAAKLAIQLRLTQVQEQLQAAKAAALAAATEQSKQQSKQQTALKTDDDAGMSDSDELADDGGRMRRQAQHTAPWVFESVGTPPRTRKPTVPEMQELERSQLASLDRAAAAIAHADVLLVTTGAGWSADSGLAVYKDIANVATYHQRGLSYRDLCDARWLKSDDKATFYGVALQQHPSTATCCHHNHHLLPLANKQPATQFRHITV
jgi:hypothetical protein